MFNFWAEPALQRLKDALTTPTTVRDTVKVTTCLLTKTGKTGRVMGQPRLSDDKQRDGVQKHSLMSPQAARCASTCRLVLDRSWRRGGGEPAQIIHGLYRLNSGITRYNSIQETIREKAARTISTIQETGQ